MKKINIAELLKDCPKGMELDCTMYDNLYFDRVDVVGGINCYIKSKDGCLTHVTFCENGCYNSISNAKCVIYPKGKTTWEGFQRPFKDGDVLIGKASKPFIFKRLNNNRGCYSYCGIDVFGRFQLESDDWTFANSLRFATEEEKQKLFKAIKDNGYRWNPETKTLNPEFKDGDIVVAGDDDAFQMFILKEVKVYQNDGYDGVCYFGWDFDDNTLFSGGFWGFNRLASEEEKERLFKTLKDNGYRWNSETKELEKLIEPKFKVGDRIKVICNNFQYDIKELTDTHYTLVEVEGKFKYTEPISEDKNWELVPNKFDITTLKAFDKVLVRDYDTQKWVNSLYSHYIELGAYKYSCINGYIYTQCIPYESNKHLLGTTNDCDDFYKTWE